MDSDDYFDDQFPLDDALDILDHEEAKFIASSSTQTRRTIPPPNPPPAKRRKIARIVPEVVVDEEDEPEIQLRYDGRYDLGSSARLQARPPLREKSIVSQRNNVPLHGPERIEKTTDPPLCERHWPPNLTQTQTRPFHTPQTHPSQAVPPTVTSRSQIVPPCTIPCTVNPPASNGPTTLASQHTRIPENSETAQSKNIEVIVLQAELETLQRERATVEDLLKAERDQRFAKEGEASILRAAIERTRKEHAADLARIQASREADIARQAQAQKQLKEEMERLRTEYTFKKHELESTVHRANMTARARRVNGIHMNSPVPVPEAMKSWNPKAPRSGASEFAGASQQTVSKQMRASPRKQVSIADPSFPGFENSFLQSSPTRSPTAARKLRQRTVPPERSYTKNGTSSIVNHSSQSRITGRQQNVEKEHLLSSPSKNRPAIRLTQIISPRALQLEEDIEMEDESSSPVRGNIIPSSSPVREDVIDDFRDYSDMTMAQVDSELISDSGVLESLDWRDELHFILLTHTYAGSKMITFQSLLAVTFSPNIPIETVDLYHKGCASLLEAMGAKYYNDILAKFVYATTKALVTMARALLNADHHSALLRILDMIYSLIIYIPSFLEHLLRTSIDNANSEDTAQDSSQFISLICDIIATHMQPGMVNTSVDGLIKETRLCLGRSTLKLLEVVCWLSNKDDVTLLSAIVRDGRVLCRLLDRDQPGEYCVRTLGILVLMATHQPLWQPLVEVTDFGSPERVDPLLNRLAKLLIDKRPMSNEVFDEANELILKFFGLLSIADTGAHAAIVGSQQVIPAVVLHLHSLIYPIYEDDDDAMKSLEKTIGTVHTVCETIRLLHHLIFSRTVSAADISKTSQNQPEKCQRAHKYGTPTCHPNLHLHSKLLTAPPSPYIGAVHIYITTIARLSYAEPPEWLPKEGRVELEGVAELARELLELIVQGPECDSVWDAFQGECDDETDPERTVKESLVEDVEMVDGLLDEYE